MGDQKWTHFGCCKPYGNEKFNHRTLWRPNFFESPNLVPPKIFKHPTLWRLKKFSPPTLGDQKHLVPSLWQPNVFGRHKKLTCGIFLKNPHRTCPLFLMTKKKVRCHQTMGVHTTLSSLTLTC